MATFRRRRGVLGFALVLVAAAISREAFIPSRPTRPQAGALLGLSAAIAAPSRSEAFEMPNLAQFFSTVFRVVTTGTNEAFDPTTEEGATALGLASPLPKEGFGEITLDDVLPFALFLLVLVIWGLLVVPSSMDRSDGAKSVLFPSQVPKLQVYVPDAVKALPAEAPILKSRRLRDPDGELLLPLKEAKRPKKKSKKSPAGFNRSKK
eukprot:s2670_g4.t1